MKNYAITLSFFILILLGSCHHNENAQTPPFVGITFSGTVTEDITTKVGGAQISVFDASNGSPIASASATSTAVTGAYSMHQLNYPDMLGMICSAAAPNPNNDAPVILLFLDNKNPNGKEPFDLTKSNTVATKSVLNITISGGNPHYPYTVNLVDKATANPVPFAEQSLPDGSHTIQFTNMEPTHKSYKLTITNTATPSTQSTYNFILPDASAATGCVLFENLTAF